MNKSICISCIAIINYIIICSCGNKSTDEIESRATKTDNLNAEKGRQPQTTNGEKGHDNLILQYPIANNASTPIKPLDALINVDHHDIRNDIFKLRFRLKELGPSGDRNDQRIECNLEAIAKFQKTNGSWNSMPPGVLSIDCNALNSTSLTALVLLAFMGNGDTYRRGKFNYVIRKPLLLLRDKQNLIGSFHSDGNENTKVALDDSLATLALLESSNLPMSIFMSKYSCNGLNFIANVLNKKHAINWKSENLSDVSAYLWGIFAILLSDRIGYNVNPLLVVRLNEWLDELRTEVTERSVVSEVLPFSKRSLVLSGVLMNICFYRNKLICNSIEMALLEGNMMREKKHIMACNAFAFLWTSRVMLFFGGDFWKEWKKRGSKYFKSVESNKRKGVRTTDGIELDTKLNVLSLIIETLFLETENLYY